MSEVLEIIVEAAAEGERLDRFLRRQLGHLSRKALQELIEAPNTRINGRPARKGQTLHAGDRIQTGPIPGPDAPLADAALSLSILHEDRDLVAVDKPAGVPSHALRLGERGTIASALLARYPEMQGIGYSGLEAGLLHRLDTDTSGVLIAARSRDSFLRLQRAHSAGHFDKQYIALCEGQLKPQVVHAYLRADQRKVRVESLPSPGSRPIVTEILSCEPRAAHSLVRVRVQLAGRHQLRAQLAALGHPIAGDTLYGGTSLPGQTRHFLHAASVALEHPTQARPLRIDAPLPSELTALLPAAGTPRGASR